MLKPFHHLIFKSNARRQKLISLTGWAAILVTVFTLTAATVFGVQRIATRDIQAISTPLPAIVKPTAVDWTLEKQTLPGGTQVYTGSGEVKRQTVTAFLEAWNALGFQSGFPDQTSESELISRYFWTGSAAALGAQELIDSARQSGTYWRREIVGQVSLSDIVEFEQTGTEASFSLGVPADSVRNELVDLNTGQVLTTRTQDVVLWVTVRFDADQGRWKVFKIATSK